MKIGIDGSRAFLKEKTGVEEYSYQVIKHLAQTRNFNDSKNKVVLYLRKGQKVDFKLPKNWKAKNLNWPRFWTQLGLSLEMLFYSVDALFVSAHVVPLIHPKKTFVVIHGLEYEIVNESYSGWSRFYMRWSIKMACRWSERIIAVSKNTKKDLIELYKIPEDKIEVIYEGVSKNFQFPISNFQSNLNDKISNYKPYLLFIGRLEKRKNVKGIIEAYEILKEKYDIPHSLVLAGSPGYGYDIIKLKIDNSLKIIKLGYIEESEKNKLIANADMFLFPTFYEGFGLPVLEAQTLGVPVVTSNVSSLPEVGGESVAYCNPQEPMSIAAAIHKIIKDESYKEFLIKKGYENVKRFDWKKCAEEIGEVLLK